MLPRNDLKIFASLCFRDHSDVAIAASLDHSDHEVSPMRGLQEDPKYPSEDAVEW
jgi:hypothetical protein